MNQQPIRTRRTSADRNSLFLIFGVCGIALASWLSRTPALGEALSLDSRALGILIFGMPLGALVGLSLAPNLLGRMRNTIFLLIFAALMAGGLAVLAFSCGHLPLPAAAFGGLVVFGLGFGGCEVLINVKGASLERERGRSLMPLFHAAFSMGTIAGSAGGVLASFWNIPAAEHLSVVAVVVLLSAFLTAPFLKDMGRAYTVGAPGRISSTSMSLESWMDRRIWIIGLVIIGLAFGEGSGNDWIALAVVETEGGTESGGAALLMLFLTAVTIVRACGGPLLDAFGRVVVLRTSALVAVVGLSAFMWSPWAVLAAAGVVLWGAGIGLGFPVCMSAAADDPGTAAVRVGKVAQIGYLVSLIGPPLLGFVAHAVGIRMSLMLTVILLLVSAVTAPGVGTGARKPHLAARLAIDK
ncbi:MFS transporter [Arthrobacter sedimenti]|uniref:MFS transporter n=1 Tax=Arthrobacter sedimenti TaxID=2694931 RepID=UPI000B3564AC|nr:MFS transporter [Arthrobacter sedimenti]OUM43483.1 hypothetical protein B8W73_06225 [Arthrobacter agilis]